MVHIPCESCAMPIQEGQKYCKFCAPDGKLLPLSKILENMSDVMAKKHGLTEDDAFNKTVNYLKKMPAWTETLEKLEKK